MVYLRKNINEKLIRQMIATMRRRVQEEVPDEGDFDIIFEMIENTDDFLDGITDIDLSVKSIPKHLEDSDTMRMLLVGVYNGSPYMCDNCLAYGDKQKVLAILDDPTLVQNILSRLPKMASDLNAD
jgi:hypothetical protein